MRGVSRRDLLDQLPVRDVNDGHPVVLLRGQVEALVVRAEKAIMQDATYILNLVDGEIWIRIVNAPHLPRLFQSQDKIRADQFRRDVTGDTHAGFDELAVGIDALGVNDLERF